ncbi:MAG: glycosyltransferase [Rhizobiales bacterium]|nr:glycosyltransferase [Hyphomicrobiales bacterium]
MPTHASNGHIPPLGPEPPAQSRQEANRDGSKRAPKLAAATVLHNPGAAILDGLLRPLEDDDLALFVFVNGALDEASEARLGQSRATVIRSPINLGLGHGLNALVEAADEAKFPFILLFDQDSVPQPGLARDLVALFAGLPTGAVALGPRMAAPRGEHFLIPAVEPRGPASNGSRPVNFLPTSGSLIEIDGWKRVGPFRADYFIDGIDIEWCFRAWSRGYGVYIAEHLTMVHRWGRSGAWWTPQILRQPPSRTYYYIRNAVTTLRQCHIPRRWRLNFALRLAGQIVLLLGSPRRHFQGLRLARHAIRDGLAGNLGEIPKDLV